MIIRNEPETRPDLAKTLKMFCNSVEIILHTVNDNEREAVLDLLECPELEISGQCFPKKPVNLSASERIVLGMFGGYRCGLIQTGMGDNCNEEVKEAFKKFPRAKFILAIGVAYALNPDKAKLGDVLFSKSIYAFGNIKASGGRVWPRDDSLTYYKMPNNLLVAFTKKEKQWPAKIGFPCAETELGYFRLSEVQCGSFLSWEVLIDDKKLRDDLREKYSEAIGGEMEGAQLIKITEELEKSAGRKIGVAIIKGVADFADGEKNKIWQLTASMAAASFT